jgi:alkaline phosphatase
VVRSSRVSRHELEWASSWTEIRKIYVNFLVHVIADHANDANILGRNVHTIKKKTEDLVIASKEIGLEVNADKTKYMVMSWDQNAGRCHDIKINNRCFERVEQLRYLGTTLTNQNSIRKENKCRLKSQNVSYHSVQNTLYKTAHLKFNGFLTVHHGVGLNWSPT